MAKIIEIDNINRPELDVYARLTEAELRNKFEQDKGIFIAESPKVIKLALAAGYEPLSLLMEAKHITGDGADLIASVADDNRFTDSYGAEGVVSMVLRYIILSSACARSAIKSSLASKPQEIRTRPAGTPAAFSCSSFI